MKFQVHLKDPDTLHDAVEEAVARDVAALPLSAHERKLVADARAADVQELAGTWFEYGEYLTVEIDTEAKSCRVVPRRELV